MTKKSESDPMITPTWGRDGKALQCLGSDVTALELVGKFNL